MDLPDLLPLFPLPGHVLLPGLAVPFRIFEPRYRALVRDLLAVRAERRWLAVPCLAPGSDPAADAPPFLPLAAAALLREARGLEGLGHPGEFLIVVEGLVRCRLREEADPTTPYRWARPQVLPDLAVAGDLDAALSGLVDQVARLGRRLGAGADQLMGLLENRDERFADRLGALLIAEPAERQDFLACLDPLARAARIAAVLTTLERRTRGGREPSAN